MVRKEGEMRGMKDRQRRWPASRVRTMKEEKLLYSSARSPLPRHPPCTLSHMYY